MKALSVIELSKLYGMTRQAVYKQVNKGNLTKNSDGKIDLAEAIRVFGEPSQHGNRSQTTVTPKLSEVHLLEQQVHMLQKQLEDAREREERQWKQLQVKDDQIESLQRLLGAPKPQPQTEQVQESTPEPIQPTPQSMPEPKSIVQESQPKPQKRRGLFGRVIRAVLD
ncbi:plasmid replication DNA-binding protein [Acinetobacter baumannii]|uniref:plasmid replication DNA-binding protein n=1 Tax=Acinetobacter baumannii TaxID=470 RepID=UPI00233FC4F5|nr:plasmid replication DNA-binding protein [Acinetobacter baumannii]